MGGYAAMALLGEDAGRIRALVLSDTQALPDSDEARAQREGSAVVAETQGVEPILETMLPKLLAPDASATARDAVTSLIRGARPAGIAAAQRGMAERLDARQHLARFSGPALVVVGTEDRVTPLEKAEQLRSLVEGSRLEVIPGAAHLPNLEQPEAFNRILDGFLSALPD
jgi:pimeloyl-ACP methyl ester carboxylesterase